MPPPSADWVTATGEAGTRRRVRCVRIKVLRGPDRGRSAVVDRTPFRIGALPSNDLCLTDPTVSGHHVELAAEGSGYRLRDLGSKNGTRAGQVGLREALLTGEVKIELGHTQLLFEPVDETVELPASGSSRFGTLIGGSLPMRELFAELERVAASDATVLVTGETGTGKEAVADALVAASARAAGPFVVVDCGALAPALVESELFGHERGAFTDAVSTRAGAFERAKGGTVLLDEIGELPAELQPKLLRVLEAREVQRVGGNRRLKIDVRIIAATHRALEEEVNRGAFRADLFYRLSVITLRVPPLRERAEDIVPLAEHFLAELGAPPELLTSDVAARLREHRFPGNVRELRNAVERLAAGSALLSGPAAARVAPTAALPPSGTPTAARAPVDLPFRVQREQAIRDFERRYGEELLGRAEGDLAKAARKAGLTRAALLRLLGRHGLLPP